MKLISNSWVNGDRIPQRFAAGRLASGAGVEFSDNISPHLSWSDVPSAAQSLVLVCHDFDVPSRGDDVNRTDREVPADLPYRPENVLSTIYRHLGIDPSQTFIDFTGRPRYTTATRSA